VKTEFTLLLDELLEIFTDIPKDDYGRGTLLKAVELLTEDDETGKTFLEKYRTLRKIFELLGPDEIKVERFDDYKWISGVYSYYLRLVLRSQPSYEPYVRQYLTKTIKYVHKSTEIQDLEKQLPSLKIDEDYFKRLEDASASKEEKAANIVFTLNRLVLVERHKNPVYESLVEKVERLIQLWKEKTKDFEKIYTEGMAVITGIENLSQRQKELGFTNLEYALLLTLEKDVSDNTDLTTEVKELSNLLNKHRFEGWDLQPTARKSIERGLRRYMRRFVKKHDLDVEALDRMYYNLIEKIKNYGRRA
jgi:type I restriction enzyme R subunit